MLANIQQQQYRNLSDYRGETVAWVRDGRRYEGAITIADPDGDVMWLYVEYAMFVGLGIVTGQTWVTAEAVTFVNENAPAFTNAHS